MRYAAWDEVFLACIYRNPLSVDEQRVAIPTTVLAEDRAHGDWSIGEIPGYVKPFGKQLH